MLTWSSWLALEGIESTLSGWASVLLSETRAAAVYWATIRPLSRPPFSTSIEGSPPLSSGVSRRKVRRSDIPPTSASAMPSRSSQSAGPWPWKFPPEIVRGSSPGRSTKTSGLSLAALIAVAIRLLRNATTSRDGPNA